MRGEDFSFDYLCDTLPSSSFPTVTLDFDFYTNPQITLLLCSLKETFGVVIFACCSKKYFKTRHIAN